MKRQVTCSQVEAELQTASGVTPQDGEPHLEYLNRLIDAIGSVPEETWDALSRGPGGAQEWFNAAATAIRDGQEIPPFPIVSEDIPIVGKGNGNAVEEEEESSEQPQPPESAPAPEGAAKMKTKARPAKRPPAEKKVAGKRAPAREEVRARKAALPKPPKSAKREGGSRSLNGKPSFVTRCIQILAKDPLANRKAAQAILEREGYDIGKYTMLKFDTCAKAARLLHETWRVAS